MNTSHKAFIAAGATALIYGATYPIGKVIMPMYIKPYGLTLIRVLGASLLFWFIGIWGPKEHIKKNDFLWIFLTSICGASLNMLFLFKGLSLTSSINVSIIVLLTPIFVGVNSYLFLKEKISRSKFLGIFIALIGASIIVLFGTNSEAHSSSIRGDILALGSPIVYSFYLIIMTRLTKKYHILTITKWSLLFGAFIVLPFGLTELLEIQWHNFSVLQYGSILFLIVGTSFLVVLLTLYSLKSIKASTFSVFMYLQPVFTILIIVLIGGEIINTIKIAGMLLVIIGCYIVSKQSTSKININTKTE